MNRVETRKEGVDKASNIAIAAVKQPFDCSVGGALLRVSRTPLAVCHG